MLVTGRAKLVVSRGGQRYVLFQTDDYRFSYPLAQNMNKSIYPEILTPINHLKNICAQEETVGVWSSTIQYVTYGMDSFKK